MNLRNLWAKWLKLKSRRRQRGLVNVACFKFIEAFERRVLPSITSLFASGALSITSDGDEAITVATNLDGNVTLNGSALIVDSVTVAAGSVTSLAVNGGSGSNVIDLSGVQAAAFTSLTGVNIDGGGAGDRITGSEFGDLIFGSGGNDTLLGVAGNDTLNGGAGNDVISGDLGADLIFGGSGNDELHGGANGDQIFGGAGNDTLIGGIGNDSLSGDTGNDSLQGDGGNDTLDGGGGNDNENGGDGSDSILGGTGRDTLQGGFDDSPDTLAAGDGNDKLYGDNDSDGGTLVQSIDGGNHNDRLTIRNDSASTLDLTQLPSNQAVSIELLNLPSSSPDQGFALNKNTVLNFSGPGNVLTVFRGSDVPLDIGSGWSSPSTELIGTQTFAVYTQGAATLQVQVFSQIPVAVNDIASATEAAGTANGTAGVNPTGNVLTNDTDADSGDTKTVTASSVGTFVGTFGTLVLAADGTFSYTVNNSNSTVEALRQFSDTLTDSFSYTLRDTAGATSNTGTLTVTIHGANDAPVASVNTYSAIEDTPLTISSSVLANDTDVEGDTLSAILVNGPSHGSLTFNANGSFRYVPAANETGSDTFTYKANDGQADSNVATVTLIVDPVNDAPSFTLQDSNITTLGGGAAITVADWAADIMAGTSNEAAQDVDFLVSSTGAELFAVAPTISPDGTLRFTPKVGITGSATVTVQIHDNGGTANGGVDTSAPQTFTITLTGLNKAPSFTKGADQVVFEDSGDQTVNWANNISAGAGESEQNLNFVVSNNNHSLFSVQPAISTEGILTYTPAADANGSTMVSVVLHDDGGRAGNSRVGFGKDTSHVETFKITVNSVNDAPSFTLPNTELTLLEDVKTQRFDGFATNIRSGPQNESLQAVKFVVTEIDNAALFVVAPTISPNGALQYKLAKNANGMATIIVHLKDNGRTGNQDLNISESQTFTINVLPLNDAPSFSIRTSNTVAEDAGPQVLANWARSITPGPADESDQQLEFQVTSNNEALFSEVPALSSSGTLTYTPAPDAFGSAIVTVRLHDDGGTDNGGVDTSAAKTFTITVTPVNDRPTISAIDDVTTGKNTATSAIPFSIGDLETPVGKLKVSATSSNSRLVPTANIKLGGSGEDRTILITPKNGKTGTATITVRVTDGNNEFAIETFQVTVVSG